jgi:hypothetical protein
MIGMTVSDDRAIHRTYRIDMEAARFAIQSGSIKHKDVVRAHEGHISGRGYRSSPTPEDILKHKEKAPALAGASRIRLSGVQFWHDPKSNDRFSESCLLALSEQL